MRTYKGQPPKNGWLLAAATINGARWELYEWINPDKPTSDTWQSLKLVVDGRARKANYWMGWNMQTEQLARHRCAALLAAHEPETLAWCETVLRDGAEAAALLYGN